jgi:methylenetetrahydrofolate reductase (NADPH)
MEPVSNLQRTLAKGKFALTAECGPPKSADPEVIRKKGEILRGCVDAVNVTDNQTAIVRMSSLASCAILKSMGIEPVLQMVTRDRNRIALQSDVLGASALGIRNILCLSGDHQKFGNMKDGKNVYDIDSIQLVRIVSDMTEKGFFLGETEPMPVPPSMFVGASENPFADPFEFRVIRLAKKIDAGAKFIQTQCVFNIAKFKKWIKMVRDEGLADKAYILGGVTPIKGPGMARYMKNNVAGMDVPDEVIKRIEGVPKEKQRDEGIKIAAETIGKLKAMDGVSGAHIMAIEWEEAVPRIIEEAGLKKR